MTTVSCVAAGECAAGGFYTDASGFRQGFVVAETGGVWSDAVAVSGTPDLGNGGDSTVVSVSCGAVGECAAGGYAGLVSIGGGQPTRTGFATQQADDASFVVVETNGVWCSNAIGVSGAAVRSYPVTYVGNGATGGSAPSGGSCPHVSGATVTVLGNGSFTRAGYTFAGWNTQADGSGAAYQPGDEFSMPASAVTLYAQWKVAAPEFLSSPVVSGTAAVGSQLSTTTGSWANGPTGYLYRWQRCSNTGSSCVNIVNATGSQYTLVLADAGHEVRSEALASNAGGPAATGYAPSAPTGVIARKPAVITLPKLSGIARVGLSLSVTNGTWKYSPTGYAYQWLRCTSLGASCRKIAGATSSSYVLTSGDAGHRLKAKVTASNAAGSVTATTSNTSATVKK